jgi:1-acyl-sn-glycerol-3-phosphate acyltransferase
MSGPTPPATRGEITLLTPRGGMSRLRVLVLAAVGLIAATLGSLLMLAVAIVTLFRARRFYSEVIAKSLGRFALWLCGVELVVHGDRPLSETQTVYVSNHTSTLDVFVLIAMGLPRTHVSSCMASCEGFCPSG